MHGCAFIRKVNQLNQVWSFSVAKGWSPAGKELTSWLSFVVSNCEFVNFPMVSWVSCGTLLYRFLIFAPLLTLTSLFWIICKNPKSNVDKLKKWHISILYAYFQDKRRNIGIWHINEISIF